MISIIFGIIELRLSDNYEQTLNHGAALVTLFICAIFFYTPTAAEMLFSVLYEDTHKGSKPLTKVYLYTMILVRNLLFL